MTHEEKRTAALNAFLFQCRITPHSVGSAFRAGYEEGTQSWQVADAEADAEWERIKATPIEHIRAELTEAGIDLELQGKATRALVKASLERNAALREQEGLRSKLKQAVDVLTAWTATMRDCPQEHLAGVLKELTKQTDALLTHYPKRDCQFLVTPKEPPS